MIEFVVSLVAIVLIGLASTAMAAALVWLPMYMADLV